MAPSIAIVAAGEMGAAIAARLTSAGCSVFTVLEGRSQSTKERANKGGMKAVSIADLPLHAEWVLSVLPPSKAREFAELFLGAYKQSRSPKTRAFVDCNAISPSTVKKIAQLFDDTGVAFIDAGIIGGPPKDGYDPTIYSSATEGAKSILDEFVGFSKFGLKITSLRPTDGSGGDIGDASALKMSYAGITKGITGLMTTMVLSANAASPATSQALLEELNESQPVILGRLSKSVPSMIPKAYRWIGEMNEIADFVDSGDSSISGSTSGKENDYRVGDVYRGMAAVYTRIEASMERNGRDAGDIATLLNFSRDAKEKLDGSNIQ